MQKFKFLLITIILQLSLLPLDSVAGVAQSQCLLWKLNENVERLSELVMPLYPEHRDRLLGLIRKAQAEPRVEKSCEYLVQVRDSLAAIIGPRVLTIKKPDPKDYPIRFSKCLHSDEMREKIDQFLKKSEKNLYPKARVQVRNLMNQASNVKMEKAACVLYDEIRNYILDLWPYQRKKLE